MTSRGKFYVLMSAVLSVVAGAYGLAGPAAGVQKRSARRAAPPAQVRSMFKENCAKCHGMDGAGRTVKGEVVGAPNFTDAAWQEGVSDKRLNASVTHGRGGMPPFENKLSRGEIASLVAFVRGFKK